MNAMANIDIGILSTSWLNMVDGCLEICLDSSAIDPHGYRFVFALFRVLSICVAFAGGIGRKLARAWDLDHLGPGLLDEARQRERMR